MNKAFKIFKLFSVIFTVVFFVFIFPFFFKGVEEYDLIFQNFVKGYIKEFITIYFIWAVVTVLIIIIEKIIKKFYDFNFSLSLIIFPMLGISVGGALIFGSLSYLFFGFCGFTQNQIGVDFSEINFQKSKYENIISENRYKLSEQRRKLIDCEETFEDQKSLFNLVIEKKINDLKLNKFSGDVILKYPSGKTKVKGYLIDGEERERWFYYYDNGKVEKEYYYKKIIIGSKCCDGTTSNSVGRGSCSHHGGVCSIIYDFQKIKVK